MNALVVTIVHTPLDARIHHRQIHALLEAGVEVTYAAPWSATDTSTQAAIDGVRTVDLPRASRRRRLVALRAASRNLRTLGPAHDVVLLHDPELLLAVIGQRHRLPPVVLDVHEDTAASLVDRAWLPGLLRTPTAWVVQRVERWAERNLHLILAEEAYQRRFRRPHPFVPNVPPRPTDDPPPPGDDRVVYVGRIAKSRGSLEMLEVARRMHGELRFELIGPADRDVQGRVADAANAGHLCWSGFVPNEEASNGSTVRWPDSPSSIPSRTMRSRSRPRCSSTCRDASLTSRATCRSPHGSSASTRWGWSCRIPTPTQSSRLSTGSEPMPTPGSPWPIVDWH